MCRNLFVATSSPGIATYALRKIVIVRGSKHSLEAPEFVHRDFYVDESVTSVFTEISSLALIAETQKILAEGGCMMTSSNGNIFRATGPLCGEFTGPGEFPTQRPVTPSFDVFFDLRLNKRLSKQP